MRSNSEYYIEQLSAERLKDLVVLHHAVYGRRPAQDFFEKKYATSFTGKQYIGFIAYSNGHEPVAYYGVIPCFLRCQGEKMLAAQSADTMTHPGYRFKGLFVELGNLCYDLCRKEGISLVFGFPNQHSYHGAVNKLGWQVSHQMDCFTIPVAALPIAKLARKTTLTRNWYTKYAAGVLQRRHADRLPNALRSEGFDGVCRDEEHSNYKTYGVHHLVQLPNALCWVKLEDALVVGDMELTGENSFKDAIKEIKQLAGKLGFREVRYQLSRGTGLHQLFAASYSPTPGFVVLFRDLGFGKALDRFKFSFADIDIF